MTSNFKYNLTKTLKNYSKYIPQLSKPVLRVLIQGKFYFNKIFEADPNYYTSTVHTPAIRINMIINMCL